ncbi:MAG: DUF4307 domain-containing protein [Dermatophilaceae bacterium]|nr:DUF4307 domain-containing protein [Intrasporangiaceae bacterium]
MSRTAPPPSNRRWVVIGGVLITAFTALVIALGVYLQQDRVRWTVTSYQVVDDRTVEVGFDVRRPADTAVVCRVRAIALDFATVGSIDVTIPADAAGGGRDVRQDVTVRTTTRANTGTVANCVVEGARSE